MHFHSKEILRRQACIFLYKYRSDKILRRELDKAQLTDKLLQRQSLEDHDYDILGTILCKLSSKKDGINYFFIFFSSGLAIAIAIYVDFIK